MSSAKIEVKIPATLRALDREIISRAKLAVRKTAFDIEALMERAILTGPKTGREYRRGNRVQRASAPGEAPASQTGLLASTIQARIENNGLTAIIGVSAEYGAILEIGTKRIEPRPFAAPALEAARPALETALQRLI